MIFHGRPLINRRFANISRAMPIVRRDDGAILIDAVECPSPEAAVECARQMSRLPGLHPRGGVHPQRMATLRTGYAALVLPACPMIFDVVGNLLAVRRQLKQIVFDDRIVRLLGKFPIRGRLDP
jgi:hypothetical protein